ncbi:uncharacterized protein TrAFT101_000271 [Trichoderma asperellum]|uniref:uncharacterized protein n=1 Tax=Trichoderma asperellum TaxID=101201 RepID=UPI003329A4F4|nr:hypothetical protein TrAFT101_000271 [Trichoderma asperellum]
MDFPPLDTPSIDIHICYLERLIQKLEQQRRRRIKHLQWVLYFSYPDYEPRKDYDNYDDLKHYKGRSGNYPY